MKKLKLHQIPTDAYVRWDLDIHRTIKRGYSIDHSTGKPEPGISVISLKECTLTQAWSLYASHVVAGTPWIVLFGVENGRDSDDMPTLDASTITIVGEIPREERDKLRR